MTAYRGKKGSQVTGRRGRCKTNEGHLSILEDHGMTGQIPEDQKRIEECRIERKVRKGVHMTEEGQWTGGKTKTEE